MHEVTDVACTVCGCDDLRLTMDGGWVVRAEPVRAVTGHRLIAQNSHVSLRPPVVASAKNVCNRVGDWSLRQHVDQGDQVGRPEPIYQLFDRLHVG